jgi:hypothetical protein
MLILLTLICEKPKRPNFKISLNSVFRVSEDFQHQTSVSDPNFRRPWRSLTSENGGFEVTLPKTDFNESAYNDRCKQAAFLLHASDQLISNFDYKAFTKLKFGTSLEVLISPEIIESDSGIY